jgi:hypothetical protein
VVTPRDVDQYMQSLFQAVNAVAELSGPPLHERRLLLEFASRAETAQRPEMNAALIHLLGAAELDPAVMNTWLPDWKVAFEAAMGNVDVDARIHPVRVNYYEKAIQDMLAGDNPHAALWPLLQTWALAADVLAEHGLDAWRKVCTQLGFTGAGIEAHANGLDNFLDEVEALLDELATQHGLETSTSI